MANRPLRLIAHHTKEELLSLWKKSKIPVERTRLRLLCRIRNANPSETSLAELPEGAAKKIGMRPSWARATIRAYNAEGLAGIADKRKGNGNPKIASEAQIAALKAEVASGTSPDGGLWTGPKVAACLSRTLGKKVSGVTGWNYLVAMGFSLRVPRPAHENRATGEEREGFKKNSWKPIPKP